MKQELNCSIDPQENSSSIFISYKTCDKALVEPIYNILRSYGINVFMSSKDLSPWDKWPDMLVDKMLQSAFFIAFVTESYITDSYQVEKEILLANNQKKQIFYILYNKELEEIPKGWKYHIGGVQALKITEINPNTLEEIASLCRKFIDNGVVEVTPEEIRRSADNFFENKEWLEALKIYERLLPTLPDVCWRIILCRLYLKQFQLARQAARAAQESFPIHSCPESAFYSALSNLAGRSEYTIKILDRVIELLDKAWSIGGPRLEYCYLSYCVGAILQKHSYDIPESIKIMLLWGRGKMTESGLREYVELLEIRLS